MDQEYNSKKNTSWAYLIVLMGLVYIWHGYQFGRNDQIEWLPYSIHLSNQHIYPTDLYINYIAAQWPNERWALSVLVSKFTPYEELACFVFHLIFFFILVSGLWKVSGIWLKRPLERSMAILLLLILFQRIDLGGNEIYYNYLVSSLPAKALGTWAIVFMHGRKYFTGIIFLIFSTFFQALVGIQLLLLLTVSVLMRDGLQQKGILPALKAFSLYLLFCGWWIVGMLQAGRHSSSLTFFELIQFRVPHHFIPSTFGVLDYTVYAFLLVPVTVWLWKQKSIFVSSFILTSIIGCLVYAIGVEVLQSEIFLKTQWFKTTLWLELWFSIALTSLLFRLASQMGLSQRSIGLVIGLVITVGCSFSLLKREVCFDFPGYLTSDMEINIARAAQDLSKPDDIFIIPFENSTFRYWSKRNVYVDFKSVLHSPDYLHAWYERIGLIYGLSKGTSYSTSQKAVQANGYYQSLEEDQIVNFSADFFLTKPIHILNFEVLAQNAEWIIYKIPDRSQE